MHSNLSAFLIVGMHVRILAIMDGYYFSRPIKLGGFEMLAYSQVYLGCVCVWVSVFTYAYVVLLVVH